MTIEEAWERVYKAKVNFSNAHRSLDVKSAIDAALSGLDKAHEDLKKAYRDAGYTGPELEPRDPPP